MVEMGRKVIDEVGNNYGRLTVVRYVGNGKFREAFWLCRCSCGNEVDVRGHSLRAGHTESCGCLRAERRTLPDGQANFNRLLTAYKKKAKNRGYEWALTKEEFIRLTKQNCFYCGASPAQKFNNPSSKGSYTYNGVDRVNNAEGYLIDNVASCCGTCNKAKGARSLAEFVDWIRLLYKNLGDI